MTKDNLSTAMKLVLVEIDGSGVDQGRTYVDKKTGGTKPLPGRQTGYIWQGARYPVKVAIDIPDGAAPYRPGNYLMAGEIFGAGDYDRLNFKGGRDLYLIPLDQAILALSEIEKEQKKAA